MSPRSLGPQTPRDPWANPRPRISKGLLHEVSRAVTDRDVSICLHCYEHRFLTTHQVNRLFFNSHTRARDRLNRLYRYRVLERFRPRRAHGSYPWYYVLDDIGVHIVAAQHGVEPKELRYDRAKALRQVYSPLLAHHTEVNDFFTALAQTCRRNGGARLSEWLGERACRQRWRDFVQPDGCGVIEADGSSVSFFLELDGATESSARLTDKLERYASLAHMPEAPGVLMFAFPSASREASARKSLFEPGMKVATAVLQEHMADPLAPVWLALGARRRISIVELGGQRDLRSA